MREKVVDTQKGPTYQMIEIKYGNYPFDLEINGEIHVRGHPFHGPRTGHRRKINGKSATGEPLVLTWEQAGQDPGWCKLDWVVADPVDQQLVNASNMLDVTWESQTASSPSGRFTWILTSRRYTWKRNLFPSSPN